MKNKKSNRLADKAILIEDINELRRIQIEILDEIALFCNKNDITYFLSYGTLLGAVRHKGYIPWDDDIDLIMLRKDYDKFNKLYINNDKFYKLSYDTNKDYWISFMKFCKRDTLCVELGAIKLNNLGINIDIFPFDYIPENKFKMNMQYKSMKLNRIIYSIKTHSLSSFNGLKTNILFAIAKPFCLIFPLSFINKRIDKIARKYNNNPSKKMECLITINNGKREILDASIFSDTVDVLFEGKYYKAPIKTKDYLVATFGDYMKLPPISEQTTHHTFDVYKLKK